MFFYDVVCMVFFKTLQTLYGLQMCVWFNINVYNVVSVVCLLKIGIQTIRAIHSVCYPNYSNIKNDIRFS